MYHPVTPKHSPEGVGTSSYENSSGRANNNNTVFAHQDVTLLTRPCRTNFVDVHENAVPSIFLPDDLSNADYLPGYSSSSKRSLPALQPRKSKDLPFHMASLVGDESSESLDSISFNPQDPEPPRPGRSEEHFELGLSLPAEGKRYDANMPEEFAHQEPPPSTAILPKNLLRPRAVRCFPMLAD